MVEPWRTAWDRALYGDGGFYRRPEGPAGHFRTAAHADAGQLAAALLRLSQELGCTGIVDVGAGRGELLSALHDCGAQALHGVDVVPRPPGLPAEVGWSAGLDRTPARIWADALVIGWELLDVVPCSVLETAPDGGLRQVMVQARTGRESLGSAIDSKDLAWCRQWWPLEHTDEGDRAESGLARDDFWASLVTRASSGRARALLAVDYGHRRESRPPAGSLTGFQRGRAVPPRPDGSMDVTAHVALDAVAAAGVSAGATTVTLTSQHRALAGLGVHSAELLDPGGLGGFGWLLQTL